jgi:predicted negative regulator of RcsB-dependent stress response
MKRKPKYKVDEIVYCRPWIRSNGMRVFKCRIIRVGSCIGYPYYDLEAIDRDYKAFTIYEEELSRRPERLVREARKEIEDYYSGYIESYKRYNNELDKFLTKDRGDIR